MSVARVTEIISSSTKGFEDAVASGVARANKTLNGIQGAWVKDTKVSITDGNITEWRVVLKITFVLND